MRIIGLDLSTTHAGIAILNENLKLLHKQSCELQGTMAERMVQIARIIYALDADELVIEDAYYSHTTKNAKTVIQLSRIAGAAIYVWYRKKKKDAKFIMASEARPYSKIKGNAQKVEVQVKTAYTYNLVKDPDFYSVCGKIGRYLQQYQSKELTRNQYKYRMLKLSKEFEELTGISEHLADAIVIATAYILKSKGGTT